MAANIMSIQSTGVRACSASGHRKSERQKPSTSSASWWTPLFGWSSEPDYIDDLSTAKAANAKSELDLDTKPSRSRIAPGSFTEEKARKFRLMTTESFHDAMYHSAIASRLASDFSNRSDL